MSLMQMRNAGHSELIVRSKRVFTSEDGIDEPRELAFYVRDGRIVSIGEPERVIAKAPSGVPVTDYGNRFICPGFHDAHLHFFHTAVGCSPYMLMYMGKSEEDLVERTVEFARNLPADAWVVTQGWRDYRWTPRQHPTKRSLDRAFPDRPCAMYSGDGHTLWLNSAALDALGVTPDTEPPAGGSFDTFENGELTGIAHEAAAMQLLPRCLEWLGEERIAQAYAQQMQRMAEQGITSMCDMSLMPMPGCDFIRDDVYDKLQEEGRLCVRAHLFPTLLDDQSRLFELQRRYEGSELLSAPGFKQFFDGVSSEHTAFLTEPYSNPRFPGDRGRLTIPAERMRELDVVASSQPCHITLDPGGPERDLGEDRAQIMWPFSTYEQRGIRQAFGTDSPITVIDSMHVIYTAVTRQDPQSRWPEGGWHADEKISAASAIRNYTLGSAYAAGDEKNLGSLEVGKYADFIVLDHDLTAIDPQEILDTQVLATYLGGTCVFER